MVNLTSNFHSFLCSSSTLDFYLRHRQLVQKVVWWNYCQRGGICIHKQFQMLKQKEHHPKSEDMNEEQRCDFNWFLYSTRFVMPERLRMAYVLSYWVVWVQKFCSRVSESLLDSQRNWSFVRFEWHCDENFIEWRSLFWMVYVLHFLPRNAAKHLAYWHLGILIGEIVTQALIIALSLLL